MTVIPNLIPFRENTKCHWQNFQTYPLERQIAIVALTILAAISSFWAMGLLAIPAFVWSVKALNPENSKEPSLLLFENETETLETVYRLQSTEWEDLHLDEEDNQLIRCFSYISHPNWQSSVFDFDEHSIHFPQEVVSRSYPEIYIRKIREGDRNTLKYFASFFVEAELHFRSPIRAGDQEHLKSLGWSFVHNANHGILDAWFVRAREIG